MSLEQNIQVLVKAAVKALYDVEATDAMVHRWEDANGETGILVWNADDKSAKVAVSFAGEFISATEPERGEIDVAKPISPNTLRLYKYRRRACSENR